MFRDAQRFLSDCLIYWSTRGHGLSGRVVVCLVSGHILSVPAPGSNSSSSAIPSGMAAGSLGFRPQYWTDAVSGATQVDESLRRCRRGRRFVFTKWHQDRCLRYPRCPVGSQLRPPIQGSFRKFTFPCFINQIHTPSPVFYTRSYTRGIVSRMFPSCETTFQIVQTLEESLASLSIPSSATLSGISETLFQNWFTTTKNLNIVNSNHLVPQLVTRFNYNFTSSSPFHFYNLVQRN